MVTSHRVRNFDWRGMYQRTQALWICGYRGSLCFVCSVRKALGGSDASQLDTASLAEAQETVNRHGLQFFFLYQQERGFGRGNGEKQRDHSDFLCFCLMSPDLERDALPFERADDGTRPAHA